MSTSRLLVYGTLKRGYSRHRYLRGQRFLGVAWTVPGYRLYDGGSYPALVRDQLDGVVEGELWEVDKRCLEILDQVEGAPDLYERAMIELDVPAGATVETYLYRQSVAGWEDIGSAWPAKSID